MEYLISAPVVLALSIYADLIAPTAPYEDSHKLYKGGIVMEEGVNASLMSSR